MMKTISIALALIAATGAAPAFAEPLTVTSIVKTADLDLSSARGQHELDRRIVRAANEVCGEASNVDLDGKNAVRQCRADTIAAATSKREVLLASAAAGLPIVIASR